MMIKLLAKAGLCLALLAAPAWSQQGLPGAGSSLDNPWANGGYQPIPLPEIEGTLPWDTLAEVELVFEGPDLIPEYSDDVLSLSGERIKMVGFMLPLDTGGERILLSQYAPHCPFCMTAGPESFVELNCEDPIEMSLEPIVVEGTFEVLQDSWDGYYYRMANVTLLDE